MATAFLLKSRQQILSDMIAMFLANTALSDFNKGSVISTFLEAASTEDFNQYFQMLTIISNYALANVSGPDLDNRAVEYGLNGRIQPQQATTTVTITDTAFVMVSTNIYAGFPGPISGQSQVYANSSSGFPSSGSIIIGRNTTNVETVPYSSITIGTNFVIFNLSSGLSNDHGTNESIILSQGGNRTVQQGTIVDVPASDYNQEIDFSLDFTAILLDGENVLPGVSVTAVLPGTASNVPADSIDTFNNLPFPTATVTNPATVTNGIDLETDDALRDRIVATIQSLSRGTATAIETGVAGVTDPVTLKRVVSSSFIDAVNPNDVAKLIIDDGTGFEASYSGQGYEVILEKAQGGETFLQTALFPIVKALVTTINSQPYGILDGQTLIYQVNNVEETVTFENSDFAIPGSGTAQEVVTAINARATLIQARTTNNSTQLQITAVVNTNEDIQVIGGTANAVNILNFPLEKVYTLNLYRFNGQTNDLLSKDGFTAELLSGAVAPYNFSLAPTYLDIQEDGETLLKANAGSGSGSGIIYETLSTQELSSRFVNSTDLADGKHYIIFTFEILPPIVVPITGYTPSPAPASVTFSGGHTVNPGDAYQIVNSQRIFFSNKAGQDFQSPTIGTSAEVCAVISRVIQGIATPTKGGTVVQLLSKLQNSALSELLILGGSANTILQFPTTASYGANSDYTLNRFNGQIQLNTPAVAGDQYTGGTTLSRGFLVTEFIQPYTLINGQSITVSVDEGAPQTITFMTSQFANISLASAAEVAAAINSSIIGATASVTADDGVLLSTNTYNTTILTPSSFTGIIPGTTTAVTLTAVTDGIPGDNIILTFTGSNSINAATAAWNGSNPANQVSVMGNGTQIPSAGTTQLSGAVGPGSMEILSSTATALGFPLLTYIPSTLSGTAFVTNTSSGPFTFLPGDSLVIVMNDDIVGSTYNIPMVLGGTVISGGSTTQFTANLTAIGQAFQNYFVNNTDLLEMHIGWITGANAGQTDTVTGYNTGTGIITITSTSSPIAPGDTFYLIPVTLENIVTYLSNSATSTLNLQATIETVENGTFLQIATDTIGTAGDVQVTGGIANDLFAQVTQNGTNTGAIWVQDALFQPGMPVQIQGIASAIDTLDTPNITFTALNSGAIGNSIYLVFNGSATVTSVVEAWNTSYPTNQVKYTGLGSIVPTAQSISLSGGAINGIIQSVTANNPTVGSYMLQITGSPDLTAYTTNVNAEIVRTNVLEFPTNIYQGVDAYDYWTGLLQIVQWTVDGLAKNTAYPGLKAAGIQIEVEAPLVIQAVFNVDPTYGPGVTENQVENDIVNAISSYVNSLSVGQTCILEQIRTDIMGINGIIDVSITSPSSTLNASNGNIVPLQQQIVRVNENNIIIG